MWLPCFLCGASSMDVGDRFPVTSAQALHAYIGTPSVDWVEPGTIPAAARFPNPAPARTTGDCDQSSVLPAPPRFQQKLSML